MRWLAPIRTRQEGAIPRELDGAAVRAAAERWGLDEAAAGAILAEAEAKYVPAGESSGKRRKFREKLHWEELLLARACAAGHAGAWEEFCRRYQHGLRASARALTRDAVKGEELADGLLGDLFGLPVRDGERRSKLSAYMGLGSLEGWLRALLAQAHVDQWRRERRLTGLDESESFRTLVTFPHTWRDRSDEIGGEEAAAASGLQRELELALETVLAALEAPARLLLNFYFLEGRTLAQIADLLEVHESTVSRRLEKVVGQLRKQVRRELGRRGLRPEATEAAMHLNPAWLQVDVRKSLRSITPTDHGF